MEFLFRTQEGRWIVGKWLAWHDEFRVFGEGALPFWEVSPGAAAGWCTENGHPELPDILCADLNRLSEPAGHPPADEGSGHDHRFPVATPERARQHSIPPPGVPATTPYPGGDDPAIGRTSSPLLSAVNEADQKARAAPPTPTPVAPGTEALAVMPGDPLSAEAKAEGQPPSVAKVDPVAELRRKGAATQAALVEFMTNRKSATFEEIARHVHGDVQTSESAIRKNVSRTNVSLIEMRIPLKFSVGSSCVFKIEQLE
jgi:hypothetical protein